ncbi:MAG: hypothetical protein AAF658_17280, partial [Myxococcota bacterium]
KPVSAFELVQHRIQPIDAGRMNPRFRRFYPTVWPRVPFFSEQLGSQKEAISKSETGMARSSGYAVKRPFRGARAGPFSLARLA